MNGDYLSLEGIRFLENYPYMVFADRLRGFFSLGVKLRTKGYYSHYMWLVGPDQVASQAGSFKVHPVSDFECYALKLVHNPAWTPEQRQQLIDAILTDAKKPWYQTIYDYVGIIGELLGCKWINIPWLNYCSERGKYLSIVDPEFDLKSPNPSQINEWTKARPDRYQVYGRYAPD